MNQLKIRVSKVLGTCTAKSPLKPGDYFTVDNGDIRIPEGSHICIWALQSLLPLIPAKERDTGKRDDDWLWRVHHAQCPDPAGRVIFKMEPVEGIPQEASQDGMQEKLVERDAVDVDEKGHSRLHDLRVVVKEVKGKCTSGMKPGNYFLLESGLISIPAGQHFCLYALQAVLPFLAAKQRTLEEGDWLKEESCFICPDPAGNVIMQIERLP
jgi:uncharacterized repeat protein (TIGR04076 family)